MFLSIVLRMRALIVNHLQVECCAGTTFHVDNGVKADVSAGTILLHHGKFKVEQYNKTLPSPNADLRTPTSSNYC